MDDGPRAAPDSQDDSLKQTSAGVESEPQLSRWIIAKRIGNDVSLSCEACVILAHAMLESRLGDIT
jgi:hypothetical protein